MEYLGTIGPIFGISLLVLTFILLIVFLIVYHEKYGIALRDLLDERGKVRSLQDDLTHAKNLTANAHQYVEFMSNRNKFMLGELVNQSFTVFQSEPESVTFRIDLISMFVMSYGDHVPNPPQVMTYDFDYHNRVKNIVGEIVLSYKQYSDTDVFPNTFSKEGIEMIKFLRSI